MTSPREVPQELARRFDVRAVARQASLMVEQLEARRPGFGNALRADPLAALATFDEISFEMNFSPVRGGCSVLGSYSARSDPPLLTVTRTASVPQTWYSALHELGHHEQQRDFEWAIPALMGDDRSKARRLEEQVCEAFAAEILLGASRVLDIIGARVPTASSIATLHEATGASRSACAVRVVQLLRAAGLAMVATADDRAVFFAAAAGDVIVPKRGTVQPEGSVVARAANAGSSRSRDASVMYGTGSSFEGMAGDAVRDGDYVYAVFTQGVPGWVDGPYAPGRTYWGSNELHCRCGATYNAGSGSPCELCGRSDRCPDCGRCACQPDLTAERRCPGCNLELAPSRFPGGSELCRDCA